MKTRVLYLLAAVTVLFSCTNENIATVIPNTDEFYCSIENEEPTRTSLDQNNNVTWSAEDQLVIFKKSSIPSKYQISESHVGKTSGSFYKVNSDEFNAGLELDHNVALYPYQEIVEITKLDSDSPTSSYKISGYNFPAEQTYTENSFANGAFPMAAVSDNYDLTFRNVCGGIKLQLKGTQKVTSIKIEGKNAEKLAGNADVVVYSDENHKPAITMASDAVTSVTLNCGSGVQLNESSATEFIIALPPMLFSKGFIVTVMDSEYKAKTIETDKANTVVRSYLLTMPAISFSDSGNDTNNDDVLIPVSNIILSASELTIIKGQTSILTAKVMPNDVVDKSVTWSIDDPLIANVDQNGKVSALLKGQTTLHAQSGGVVSDCKITVVETIDYIDEYGINHGCGIAIGNSIWAPVNCGYKKSSEEDKGYPYGKLYQYGRRYGQGYTLDYDATIPELAEGGVSVYGGQLESNANIFFTGASWVYPKDDDYRLWQAGQKTEYDPCPVGWKVPTRTELNTLTQNITKDTIYEGVIGCWVSGGNPISDDVSKIFLPLAGYRSSAGYVGNRGEDGYYWFADRWSDRVYRHHITDIATSGSDSGRNDYSSSYGYSVRCVQE